MEAIFEASFQPGTNDTMTGQNCAKIVPLYYAKATDWLASQAQAGGRQKLFCEFSRNWEAKKWFRTVSREVGGKERRGGGGEGTRGQSVGAGREGWKKMFYSRSSVYIIQMSVIYDWGDEFRRWILVCCIAQHTHAHTNTHPPTDPPSHTHTQTPTIQHAWPVVLAINLWSTHWIPVLYTHSRNLSLLCYIRVIPHMLPNGP